MGFFSFLKKEKQSDAAMQLPDDTFSDIPQVRGANVDLPLPPTDLMRAPSAPPTAPAQKTVQVDSSAPVLDARDEAQAFADAFSVAGKMQTATPAMDSRSAPSNVRMQTMASPLRASASAPTSAPMIKKATTEPTITQSPFDIPAEAAEIPDTIPDLASLPDAPAFGKAARPMQMQDDAQLLQVPQVAVLHSPHGYPNDFAYDLPQFNRQEIVRHDRKGPLFVRVEVYQQVLNYIKEIEITFKEEENNAERLNDLKNAEDKEFERFRELVEDIERKLLYVDKTLFEE